jgi:hypothetical protein
MFHINRLRLEIKTTDRDDVSILYGFDIPFKKGLNLIAGENSRGKSTISTLIYYALGMEELLGGQNEKWLDKSLKSEFEIYEHDVVRKKNVLSSIVFIELTNWENKSVTLKRNIKITGSAENAVKNILVYECKFEEISNNPKIVPLFIRNNNNNEDEFGFFRWFADFIGLQLPRVTSSSKKEGESVLYLQTIFPALFIEQTKGWSDFLATIPYFGIPRNKEKSIAFLLGLKELEVSALRDRIAKQETELKSNWTDLLYKIRLLAEEYSAQVNNIPNEITIDKSLLESAILVKHGRDSSELLPIIDLQARYITELELRRKVPFARVGDNKATLRLRIEDLYKMQNIFLQRFQRFDLEFNSEKIQLDDLRKHLLTIEREISSHQGIKNIFDHALIKSDVYHTCPTCKQDVSDDLLLTEGITIEKLSVEENLAYLQGQKKIMGSAIESLKKIISEKLVVRKYYLKKQREFEEEIKLGLQELIADDRDYSEGEALYRVRLESTILDLNLLQDTFSQMIEELEKLSITYEQLQREKSELEDQFERDQQILVEFERSFKFKYLFPFGYSSNAKTNIFIQKSEPFKYFPVFKYSESDLLPQPIKNNSSASDFIRTLWSYSLALLEVGSNHPGVVIFDEPGQHSVKSSSLKSLFEGCAKVRDKQIIIFTSVEKDLSIASKDPDDKLNLDKLIEDLEEEIDYSIYKIQGIGKSIAKLN